MTTANFEDYSYPNGRPYLVKGEWRYDGRHRESYYRHPLGVAEVDEYRMGDPVTAIRFIWNGRTHVRRWQSVWGDKTLARLARELIEEVTA